MFLEKFSASLLPFELVPDVAPLLVIDTDRNRIIFYVENPGEVSVHLLQLFMDLKLLFILVEAEDQMGLIQSRFLDRFDGLLIGGQTEGCVEIKDRHYIIDVYFCGIGRVIFATHS